MCGGIEQVRVVTVGKCVCVCVCVCVLQRVCGSQCKREWCSNCVVTMQQACGAATVCVAV